MLYAFEIPYNHTILLCTFPLLYHTKKVVTNKSGSYNYGSIFFLAVPKKHKVIIFPGIFRAVFWNVNILSSPPQPVMLEVYFISISFRFSVSRKILKTKYTLQSICKKCRFKEKIETLNDVAIYRHILTKSQRNLR